MASMIKRFKALNEQHVWDYLHQAIEVAEACFFTSLTGKVVVVGAADIDGAEQLRERQTTGHTARPQTRRIGAGAATVPVPAMPFAEPYPKRQHLMTTVVTITAVKWETRHAHWLDEILKRRRAGKIEYTAIIEKEVTKETVPLIRDRRRDDIFNWLTPESPKSKALQLSNAPFAHSIEGQTTIDAGFVEEPDMIRQALREIEGIAFQLKKRSPHEAVRLKALTDELFACRDYQLDNETDVAGEIRKAFNAYYEPKVDTVTLTLGMVNAQVQRPATGSSDEISATSPKFMTLDSRGCLGGRQEVRTADGGMKRFT
ncbi:hypothetical protein Neosp_011647 [[Neocosmospora] mangrovei]